MRSALCRCLIDDPAIIEARQTNRTRAQTAMRTLGKELDGAIVAIGNAPTALREVLALAAEGMRAARHWSSACPSALWMPPSRKRR